MQESQPGEDDPCQPPPDQDDTDQDCGSDDDGTPKPGIPPILSYGGGLGCSEFDNLSDTSGGDGDGDLHLSR